MSASPRFADLADFVRAACGDPSEVALSIALLPFRCGGEDIGWVKADFAERLERWPLWFQRVANGITLRTTPDTPEARSAAMAHVSAALATEGTIHGWRDELVGVTNRFGADELFRIERAATRHFGLMAYASHATGHVVEGGDARLWISRRAVTKSVDPGLLDNLVGGRIAAGFSPSQTIMKEAWEEAGIPVSLLAALKPASVLRVAYPVPEGLHQETLYAYDFELPAHFTPTNQDGEVESITRMSVSDTLDAILAGEFTHDAGIVTVDFLLRRGHLSEADVGMDALRMLLRA